MSKLDKMHENLMNQMETGFNPQDITDYAKEANLYISIYIMIDRRRRI